MSIQLIDCGEKNNADVFTENIHNVRTINSILIAIQGVFILVTGMLSHLGYPELFSFTQIHVLVADKHTHTRTSNVWDVALTYSAAAELYLYVNRSDWWTPENDATRRFDLNGSWNYHSGTNKMAAHQIKHGRRPTGTVVRRPLAEFILTSFFGFILKYSCSKSSLSMFCLPPFPAFVPKMKNALFWFSMFHYSYRPYVSPNRTSQKAFSGTMS